jgi:hypothetical protein
VLTLFSLVLAAFASWSGTLPPGSIDPPLTGAVRSVNGGPIADVRVFVSCGALEDSVALDGAGRFELSIDCSESQPHFRIEDPAGRYFPSLPRARDYARAKEPTFLVIPRVWNIASGTHSGRTVAVDLRGATAPSCRPGCSAFFPAEDTLRMSPAGIPFWLEGSLPLRLAYNNEDGIRIDPADSLAFIRVAEALEQDLGRRWFQPTRLTDVFNAPPGDPFGSVIFSIDPHLSTPARANWVAQRGEIVAGVVYFQSPRYIRDRAYAGIVAHELMHALGFGHTCSWRSVVAGETCPGRRANAPTAEDVAHAQLLLRLRTLERIHGIHGSIAAALTGTDLLEPAGRRR